MVFVFIEKKGLGIDIYLIYLLVVN